MRTATRFNRKDAEVAADALLHFGTATKVHIWQPYGFDRMDGRNFVVAIVHYLGKGCYDHIAYL